MRPPQGVTDLDEERELARQLANAENRERKRLASHLHDELQQYLVALKFHLSAAATESTSSQVDEYLEKSQGVLKQAIRSSRSSRWAVCSSSAPPQPAKSRTASAQRPG